VIPVAQKKSKAKGKIKDLATSKNAAGKVRGGAKNNTVGGTASGGR
jgi:hypothetical protein